MEVLEHDDQRVLPGGRLQRRPPGGEQQVLVHSLGAGLPDRGREQPRVAVRVLHADPFQPDPDRVADLAGRRVLGGAGEGEEDLAHGPVGELLAVGQALRGRDHGVGREAGQPVEELLDQPRLADAGGRDDADHRGPPLVDRTPRDQLQLRQVVLPADQRQAVTLARFGLARTDDDVRGDRCRLASRRDVDLVAELEVVGRADRAVAGQDRPGLGRLLQARRHVGGVAGDQEVSRRLVAAGHHLSRADTEADGNAAVQVRVGPDALAHGQRGGDGAVRVVAVRGGQAEHGHHRVADELLYGAAVLLDALARDAVVAREDPPHLLGVELFAERGRPRHVGKEHSDNASLLGRDSHRAT